MPWNGSLIGSRRKHMAEYNLITSGDKNRTSLAESVESHLMGIAAEESRHNGGKTIRVHR